MAHTMRRAGRAAGLAACVVLGLTAGCDGPATAPAEPPRLTGPTSGPGSTAGGTAAGAVAGGAGGATAAAGDAGRLIARTLSLDVESKHPIDGVAEARKIAAELDGFVLATTEEGSGAATVALRVPAGRAEAAAARLRGLGKVVHELAHGEDVTEGVRDLHIRLDNARRTREAYVGVLARAGTVEETLAVEKEMERATVEIETLEGRLTELESGVKLAAFDVRLHRPVRPGPLGWVFYGGYRVIKWLFVWD
jgi:hypothetical protein